MSNEEILQRLRTVMQGCTTTPRNWEAVNASTPVEALGFDSLTMLDLLYDIQHEFRIQIEPEILAEIHTVGDAADKIRQLADN